MRFTLTFQRFSKSLQKNEGNPWWRFFCVVWFMYLAGCLKQSLIRMNLFFPTWSNSCATFCSAFLCTIIYVPRWFQLSELGLLGLLAPECVHARACLAERLRVRIPSPVHPNHRVVLILKISRSGAFQAGLTPSRGFESYNSETAWARMVITSIFRK